LAKKASVLQRSDGCRDGLKHSCFVRRQSISLLKERWQYKNSFNLSRHFGSGSLVPNGSLSKNLIIIRKIS